MEYEDGLVSRVRGVAACFPLIFLLVVFPLSLSLELRVRGTSHLVLLRVKLVPSRRWKHSTLRVQGSILRGRDVLLCVRRVSRAML